MAQQLKLSIDAPGAQRAGAAVYVNVTLRNGGDTDVLVNGRMVVDEEEGLEEEHELVFELTDPSGEVLPFMLDVDAFEPGPGDFLVLAPGQGHTRRVRLDDCFRFRGPGTYRVQATYHNDVAYQRGGLQAFTGTLPAAQVMLILE